MSCQRRAVEATPAVGSMSDGHAIDGDAAEVLPPMLAALRAWQHSPDDGNSQAVEEAAQHAHRVAIAAFAAGNFRGATQVMAGLQVLAQDYYRHDPPSLHALYGDYAMLLGERGEFIQAASLLDLALVAAAESGDLAPALTLRTLATYIGMAQTTGDDALVDALLDQAGAIEPTVAVDALTKFKLNAARASVMLARARIADAEQLLLGLPREFADDALHAPEMSRCWGLLAQSYAGRQWYRAAFAAHAKALAIIERHPEHRHARADAISALAQTRRILSSGAVFSRDWWRSKVLFAQALRLQRSPNPPNPSTGCAELFALALMALRERRASRAMALHLEAIRLARHSWSIRSRKMQDILLGRVAIDMARRRFSACLRRLRRILAALRALGPAAARSLANARALEAELYRRIGQPTQAAMILEELVALEMHEFASAIGSNWSAYETGLARRGVLTTHAFVDAILPAALTDRAARARLFRVIAHSQDLGLRTLRQMRGAAPAQFKTAPTAAAVAAILPAGNVFVQIFRRTPRAQGFSGAEWRPERAEYIALVVRRLRRGGPREPGPSAAVGRSRGDTTQSDGNRHRTAGPVERAAPAQRTCSPHLGCAVCLLRARRCAASVSLFDADALPALTNTTSGRDPGGVSCEMDGAALRGRTHAVLAQPLRDLRSGMRGGSISIREPARRPSRGRSRRCAARCACRGAAGHDEGQIEPCRRPGARSRSDPSLRPR